MRNSISNIIRIILSIAILLFLLRKIGIEKVIVTFTTINLRFLPIIIFLGYLPLLFAIINLRILLTPFKIKVPTKKLIKYYLLSWSFGTFVPAKLGEFSLVYFLKKEGLNIGPATVICILDRLITIFIISLLALFGLFNFLTRIQAIYFTTLIFGIGFISYILIFTQLGRGFIKRYLLRSYSSIFKDFSKTINIYFTSYNHILILNGIITTIKWTLMCVLVYITFLAFNQNIDFISVLLLNSVVSLISLIPLSMNGIGIKESAAVFFYTLINIPSYITVSVYLIFLCITYFQSVSFIIFLLRTNLLHICKKTKNYYLNTSNKQQNTKD